MVALFLAKGGDILIMVVLFVLVVLGLVCVFSPTPHSHHGVLSSSHIWHQMLLPK